MSTDLRAPGPTITYANSALSALTGYPVDELVGQSMRLLQGPASGAAELRRRKRALTRTSRYRGQAINYRKDGTCCVVYWSITSIPGRAGTVQGWLALLHNDAEHRDRSAAPLESDTHRKALFEGIPHLVWQSYDAGRWHAASPQWVAFTGQTEVASLGSGWRSMIAPQDRAVTDDAWRAADAIGVMAVEHRIRRHDGIYRWFQTRALPVVGQANVGHQRMWVGTSTDIDDQRVAEERIRHLAYHDILTDTGNRCMLRDTLDRMTIGPSAGIPFNVFFLDVDDFKAINDRFGHQGGDEVLREVSQRMLSWSRPVDTVARVGGDEFVLVQANATSADSLLLAQRIRKRLLEPFVLAGQQLQIGASIGIASYPRDGRDAEALLRRADIALYGAKTGGGQRLQQFEPEMEQVRNERYVMQAGLARAIDCNELSIAYQAISSVETGTVLAYEALARWTHPELGSVSPASFIPIAEEGGLITAIGQWVLEGACRDAAAPIFAGRRVAINLSPLQFRSRTLARTIEDVLAQNGLSPSRLELEVTERLLIHDDADVNQTLQELKAIGVSIALDDFGTGHSNLEYLCRFQFDRLKIDKSFVRRMVDDDGARTVVGAIIALAHNLQLHVTAEGVETKQQLALLREMGCDTVQGFLLGRPVPVSDIA